VKEFGVSAVYTYSGVDRDGTISFAASEDLERVVKVIDLALEFANDNYEADVLPGTLAWGLGGSATQHKATEDARRSSPSRMTPEHKRRPRSGNEKRPSRRI
jgi:hypothetical protein